MLSNVLKELNVSHSVMSCLGPNCQYQEVHGTASEQPAWPVVLQSVNELNRVQDRVPYDRIIAFVYDSRAVIANSNLTIWSPCLDMYTELQTILLQEDPEPFQLKIEEPNAMGYVLIASKPSVLSELQSTWCKINPYSLRKKIQEAVIRYLCSDMSRFAMKRVLSASQHGDTLAVMLMSDQAVALRNAVSAARLASSEEAAKKFNIDPFDINFLLSSWRKCK